ncbi:helix-turn-helix domain-containing protein [Galactobacillus timonensis]|jgi:aryl carrier-like protein|uniref:helix-turn-helix domain-containing protein n=1 Tax=Galactobacillus timonensis TaxID=2041840 RepID=UPI000C8198BD|nr:helix-turn-helix domain-containing protein [Galactobacillus timonensis]
MNNEDYQLVEVLLTDKDIDHNTETCAAYLGCPIVVIAPSLAIVSWSRNLELPDPIWINAVKRGYITIEFGATLSHWLNDPSHPNQMTIDEIPPYRRRFYRLVFHDRLVGYLNLGENRTSFEDIPEEKNRIVRRFFERILSERSYSSQSSTTTAEDIVTGLLNEQFVDRLHFLEMVSGTGLDNVAAKQCLSITSSEIQSYNAGEDTFRDELHSLFPSCITAIAQDHLLVLLFPDQGMPVSKVTAWLRKHRAAAGLSAPFHDLYQLRQYDHQASFARIHGSEEGPLKTYRSCQHLDLLYSLSKEDIAPYISEESRRLHVQRNTIAYRLDHIRTTRLDLDDPWLQQEYCISCELLQIESEKQS